MTPPQEHGRFAEAPESASGADGGERPQGFSAEACMLASMLLPGAGHVLRRQWRVGALTFTAFLAAAAFATAALTGRVDLRDPVVADLFFAAVWTAVAIWFFGLGDSGHAPTGEGPNPRIAFLLNFCSRGLGYFYVQRPALGALAMLGWAVFLAHGPHLGLQLRLPLILVLQSCLGLHAYRVATRQHPDPARPRLPLRRLVLPALIVGLAGALAMQTVSAAVQAMADNASRSVTVSHEGTRLDLEEEGLSLTLPTAEWRFEPSSDGNAVGSFVSPRAHLILLRAQPDRLGLEGFIAQLAGEIARAHGSVKLTDQRRLACGDIRGGELSFEWTEEGLLHWTHLFIVPRREGVHLLLVAFPARLDGGLRQQVEALVKSFRYTR